MERETRDRRTKKFFFVFLTKNVEQVNEAKWVTFACYAFIHVDLSLIAAGAGAKISVKVEFDLWRPKILSFIHKVIMTMVMMMSSVSLQKKFTKLKINFYSQSPRNLILIQLKNYFSILIMKFLVLPNTICHQREKRVRKLSSGVTSS